MTLGKNMAIAEKYSNCWQNNLENPKIMDGQILFTESNRGGVATNSPQFGVWALRQLSTMPHCKNNLPSQLSRCWVMLTFSVCSYVRLRNTDQNSSTQTLLSSISDFRIVKLASTKYFTNQELNNAEKDVAGHRCYPSEYWHHRPFWYNYTKLLQGR